MSEIKIKLDALRAELAKLDAAQDRIVETRGEFNRLLQDLAAKTNLAPAVIRALAKYRATDRAKRRPMKARSRQLADLLEKLDKA